MKKKNEWISINETGGTKNELRINDAFIGLSTDKKIAVIYNHEKKSAKRFSELKSDQTSLSAKITLKFVTKRSVEDVNAKDEVEYWLTNKQPKNEEEKEKLTKQAHENYIIDNGLIDYSGEQGEDIIWTIKREEGEGIKLEITKKDSSDTGTKIIKNLKIEAEFYLIDKVTIDDVINYPSAEGKSPWTKGWITFFIILAIIILLVIIFFHKKIWRWIKGERKQEKKVREQIDIF